MQTLLKSGKEYICIMHLHKEISQSKIQKTAKQFIGKIKQIPPIKSAVKRQERTREIYYLKIYEIEGKDVLFKVGCEAGTYVRKLVHDWAKKIGTGGHMQQLVRTKAGPFTDKDWITMHDLKDAYEMYKEGKEKHLRKIIQPMENGLNHLPKIWVIDTAVDTLCHGADLSIPGIAKLHSKIKKEDIVGVMTLKGELVCLGESRMTSEEMMKQEKGVAITTKKVFMEPDIYPKFVRQQKA